MSEAQASLNGKGASENGKYNREIVSILCVYFCNLIWHFFPLSISLSPTSFAWFAVMLKISPGETITFHKTGNELLGTVDITNVVKHPITYKV